MPLTINNSQFTTFKLLFTKQLASADFDAEHPMYIQLITKEAIPTEDAIWLSILYMAFYDEASAWIAFQNGDPFSIPKVYNLPIGRNRRNLYGGRILQHFESLQNLKRLYPDWPTHNFVGDQQKDWYILNSNLAEVWGNGRFGGYTTAEMFHKVNNLPVEVMDFDNRKHSKPMDGVKRIHNYTEDNFHLINPASEVLYNKIKLLNIHPTYTTLDRGVVESVLCNYSGLCRGKFYSGRNLDRQWDRLTKVESLGFTVTPLWEIRSEVFNHTHLCEYGSWRGVDSKRLKLYQLTGKVPWVHEER